MNATQNNLHPLFQQILAPFAPKERKTVHLVMEDIGDYDCPKYVCEVTEGNTVLKSFQDSDYGWGHLNVERAAIEWAKAQGYKVIGLNGWEVQSKTGICRYL